ncbi:SDR family oxidoreductase [Salicibibacter cibarius]|uniref:SDR family oxidoreductase n=1 Tax=Salicibibacter cibarius TaxID=2743000 RepID=A0A7T6Z3U8_9BACI|nr:SDR family oxidoreductase [Salicibibacter cibarius]QQK76530.1 SDR family oxidoreductase [Salicibibacter cibarius]
MDLNLNNKKVLVTGGSRGIGKGIARVFLEEGANVGVVARGQKGLDEVKQEFKNIRTYQADLTEENERIKCMNEFINDFSNIDVLINNSGGSNGGDVLETHISTFKEAMEYNYYSAVHFSKLAAQHMLKQQSGSIINITSITGRESGGKVTYNNAKSALISFTKAFANEAIRYGIRVNSVAPGAIIHLSGAWQKRLDENPEKINQYIQTNIPAGRFGIVQEVADVVVFLASEKANWVVGATLNVDGGQSRSNF